jgi:hypothetical protein
VTALAEKLKDAGADTVGAQLTTACVEGLRLYPNNPRAAWDYAFNAFGRQFVAKIMNDMAPAKSPTEEFVRSAQSLPLAMPPRELLAPVPMRELQAPKPYAPRIIQPERLEKRRKLQETVRSKYKNSAGVAWTDVSWHELIAMGRDGKEAAALLAACQSVPNDGRTVGDVLGVKKVDEIIAAVREMA